MPNWPIVARAAELRQASQALRPGSGFHGVALVGEAGVGKTTLAHDLAQNLESDGWNAHFVLGTETGQAVPLGAFHRTLAVEDPHEPAMMLAAAHRALTREDNLVIVVDDAQLLDALSALLVSQLAASGTTRLIVTIRSGEVVPDAVTALWKERLLQRLDVAAFTRAQTGELVRAVLDGDVDARVVDRLHDLAAGSPLVLRGLLVAAQGDGSLVRDADGWHLAGPLRVGPDLGELFRSRLGALPADEREVVEIVSVAELLDWDILRGLCDVDAVTRAERRGAIQFIADGSRTLVRPGHPILGEVVRQCCGVVRSRQLNTLLAQSLSEFLRTRAQGPEASRPDVRTQIQLAQVMTRSDLPPDLDVVTHAAASAVTMSNIVLGEQLAQFAYGRGGGLQAAIVLADAISWQGRGQEAEAVLGAFDPSGPDELTMARWGCLRAANLFFGCGRVDAARAVLATVRERVRSELMLSFVTAMEVSFAFFRGDLPLAVRVGSAALDAEMMPIATVWAAMGTAGALALSGRFGEVGDVAEKGVHAAERCDSGPQRYAIGLAEVLGCISAGDLTAAERVCDRYSAMTAGVPQAEAIVSALVGRVDLARGRVVAASEALQRSLWTMSESLPRGWVMLVAAWSARAEAERGNSESAGRALARAEEATGPQVAVFQPELELARAWEHAAVGETTAARIHAEHAARTARRGGMHAVEMSALHTAVRFGDRAKSMRLRELAQLLCSPFAAAATAHARGLADHDGARLDAAADQFDQMGAVAMAADAAAHAAREHARAGQRIKELESATRAHRLASQNGLYTPATSSIESPLPITDREREIATLVAAGLSNREISERLSVSIRTVEGHLYRMFTKLGIDDRDELARLLHAPAAN